MSDISAQSIPGGAVYGVTQFTYTVDGKSGRDYGYALAAAALSQAGAFEKECAAFSDMVRLRMNKLDDLGEALAILARTEANLKTKKPKSDDKSFDSDLPKAQNLLAKYGLSLSVKWDDGKSYMTRGDIQTQRSDLQFAIDREDNDLQQDTVSLQSLLSKRDNAFSTASKLMNKVNKSGKTIIDNFGA